MSETLPHPIAPDDPAHQHLVARLAQRMSDISEDTWYAGWLIDLEYLLWDAVQGGTGHPFAQKDLRELRELSSLVGGWHDGDRFIPIAEWLSIAREHALKLRAGDPR